MHSRWSYVLVGITGVLTLIGAVLHSPLAIIVNFILTIWNWYGAENLRMDESSALVKALLDAEKNKGEDKTEENDDLS